MVKAILNIIPIPNILLVILTQFLIYFLILKPAFDFSHKVMTLNPILLFLLILTTVSITISGYLINDIYDRKIEAINSPDRHWISTGGRLRKAWTAYFTILILGSLISIYISFSIGHPIWFIIYPISVSLLFLYAHSFKSSILIGNIIVSVFCAGVIGILLIAEWHGFKDHFSQGNNYAIWGMHILIAYMLFAFISNFIRELIKDIEDMEGDKSLQIRTFPIVFGISKTKVLCILLSVALILSMGIWILTDLTVFDNIFSILIGIAEILALFLFLLWISLANKQTDFSSLSTFAKIIMATGMVMLILLKLNYG